MSQLGIARLAVKVLRHSVGWLRRAIFVLFVFIVETAVEVRRSFVLIRATVICISCDEIAHVA